MIEIRSPSGDSIREKVSNILIAHAKAAGFPFSMEEIELEARDGDTFLGGLTAKVGPEWVFVELLAVDDAARGKGVGRRLMDSIEAKAREIGRAGVWLDTFAFQAAGFYERLGYSEVGRIEDYPKGSARIFYAKRFAA